MNERFTIEYIKREASIIIRFFKPSKKKSRDWLPVPFNDMDHRIMRNLGIK